VSCSELLSQDEWDEMLVCGIVCVVYVAVCVAVRVAVRVAYTTFLVLRPLSPFPPSLPLSPALSPSLVLFYSLSFNQLKAAALLSCAHAVASGGVVQAPTITSTVASAGAAAGGSRVRGDGLAATPDTIFT